MDKGKTIKQISEEIGVSKQAVQKRITREPLFTELKNYISTIDGVKYIDINGESLIKSAYSSFKQQPVSDTVHKDIPNNQTIVADAVHTDVHSIIKDTIEALNKQLAVKDKQIEALTEANKTLSETNKSLSQSINADRHNNLAETIIDSQAHQIEEKASEPSKPTRWGRLKQFIKGE